MGNPAYFPNGMWTDTRESGAKVFDVSGTWPATFKVYDFDTLMDTPLLLRETNGIVFRTFMEYGDYTDLTGQGREVQRAVSSTVTAKVK